MKLFGGRTLRKFINGDPGTTVVDYDAPYRVEVTNPDDADLVCSDLPSGLHRPVIDFDLPVTLVPSGTPGNSHLYIEANVTWMEYAAILNAFVDAGIVQEGFRDATLRRGFGSVRVPWKPKVTS